MSFLTASKTDSVCRILKNNLQTEYFTYEFPQQPNETSYHSFLAQISHTLHSHKKPILIKQAMSKDKFLSNWESFDRLYKLASEESQMNDKRKYTVYKPSIDGHLNQSDAIPYKKCSFQKFLDLTKTSSDSLYMLGVPDIKNKQTGSPLEYMKGDTDKPVFTRDLEDRYFFYDLFTRGQKEGEDIGVVRRNVFLNFGYCYTNLHYDTDNNAYLCVSGQRRWNICHPDQGFVFMENKLTAANRTEYTRKQWEKKNPLFKLIKFMEIDLFPGDVLLVPSSWWHIVEGGIGGGLSCGVNWFFESNTGSTSIEDIPWNEGVVVEEDVVIDEDSSYMNKINKMIDICDIKELKHRKYQIFNDLRYRL
jgi:Cupin-like domain